MTEEFDNGWYCDDETCNGNPHGRWQWSHCRSEQRPPSGLWFIWLMCTGRGAGKSRAAAQYVTREALSHPRSEWAVVAPVGWDVEKCFSDLSVGIMTLLPADRVAKYSRIQQRLELTNGSIIYGISADKPDRLRGLYLNGCWAEGVSTWHDPDAWFTGILPAMRPKSHIVVTTTPRGYDEDEVPLEENGILQSILGEVGASAAVVVNRFSSFDNEANLAPQFLAEMTKRYVGTKNGRSAIYGEIPRARNEIRAENGPRVGDAGDVDPLGGLPEDLVWDVCRIACGSPKGKRYHEMVTKAKMAIGERLGWAV